MGGNQNSYQLLSQEGITESVPGKGTRIKSGAGDSLSQIVIVTPFSSALGRPYYCKIIEGITSRANYYGIECKYVGYSRVHSPNFDIVKETQAGKTTGLVLLAETSPSAISTASRLQGPAIQADHKIPGLECDSVVFDASGIGREAAEHLIGKGRRNIAYIGWSKDRQFDPLKFESAVEACRASGIGISMELVRWVNLSICDATAAMTELINSGMPLDAVICNNTTIASGALAACRNAGKKIPQDISIVSLCGILQDEASEMFFSRFEPDFDKFCGTVVTRLLQRFRKPSEPPQDFSIPASFVQGESS